ncbi:chorismate mutase [Fusobacterium sp.]|uniref:chorismate mutase n=1 Tax=Fusobacterium sp. TaxID=68766 RepID=UPI00262B4041|nr:chorismate mutase [Fusobacterium sp.]
MININNNLNEIRITLDKINTKIASLLSERVELVKIVGKIKKQEKNFYVPEREKFIFKTLTEKFPELDKNIIKSLFTQIISGCRSYEKIFEVGLKEDVYSLSALINILGTFTSNHFFKDIESLKENYNSLDYVLIKLDESSLSLVENTQDIFIVNEHEDKENKFLLLGKIENKDILSGKIGFLLEKNNFTKIKDRLYNLLYKTYSISSDNLFIEINYSEKDNIQDIKDIFSVPHKYMGIYPNNNF